MILVQKRIIKNISSKMSYTFHIPIGIPSDHYPLSALLNLRDWTVISVGNLKWLCVSNARLDHINIKAYSSLKQCLPEMMKMNLNIIFCFCF